MPAPRPPISRRLLKIAAAPHLPRRTIRLRLTGLYGLLFTLSGAALLVITNLLVRSAAGQGVCREVRNGAVVCDIPGRGGRDARTIVSASNAGGSFRPKGTAPRQVHELGLIANSQNATDLHHLLIYSWFALAIMALLSVALGWLVAGRVLRPIRTITATARSISASNLHERLGLAGPDDELKELGDTFDDLLARLEQFIKSQRQFVANASHELRTPLALQRTLIQLALTDPEADVESLRAAHERVLASGAQQERVIEALLTLSRGQAGLTKREPFDLAILAEQVLLAREYDARIHSIEVRPDLEPAPMTGDPRLVERLVANLVDNGLAYNADPGRLDIMTECRGDAALLSVTNAGPVVEAGAVGRLTQPFERLAAERSGRGDGSGLGLSIVQAIVNAHGGSLTIRPRPRGGLTVEVTFPSPAVARPRAIANSVAGTGAS
jgi:signal transduction histidine kinase